jgi:hypothetical protein
VELAGFQNKYFGFSETSLNYAINLDLGHQLNVLLPLIANYLDMISHFNKENAQDCQLHE